MLECTARMLGLKALQPCYCTNTSARQGCHQQSAVFAARESCSLVNAAWVHVVRLGIHNWLHSVKVWCIVWGGAVVVGVLKWLASATFPSRPFLSKQPLILLNCTDRELRRREPARRAIDLVPASPVVIAVAQNGPGGSRCRGARGRRVVVTAVEARLHRRLLAAKHHGTFHPRPCNIVAFETLLETIQVIAQDVDFLPDVGFVLHFAGARHQVCRTCALATRHAGLLVD